MSHKVAVGGTFVAVRNRSKVIGGVFTTIKRSYAAVWVPDSTKTGGGEMLFRTTAEYVPPDKYVSGPYLTRPSIRTGVGEFEVGWTVTSGLPESGWSIHVTWFVNGSPDASDNAAQSATVIRRSYDVADAIAVEIQYSNGIPPGGPVTPISSLGTAPTAAPSSLNATTVDYDSITVTFSTGDSDSPTRVYYRVSGGAWSYVTLNQGDNSHTFNGLSDNTTYEFYAKHYDGGVESAASNTDTATTTLEMVTPTGMTAADASYCSGTTEVYQINLSWTRQTVGANSRVQRQKVAGTGLPTGTWTTVGTTSGTTMTDTDAIEPGYRFYYRVQHYVGTDTSDYSTYTYTTVAALNCQSTTAPTVYVTGISLFGGTALSGPSDHTISWDTTSASPQSSYDVKVRWYINGVWTYTDTVDQSAGQIVRNLDTGDSVYCQVAYTNSAGDGPFDDSNTV